MMNRRQFIKQGIMVGSALVVGSSLYGCSDLDILDTELINDDVHLSLAVILPVFLSGALDNDSQVRVAQLNRTIKGMTIAMQKLPPHTLDELNDLFSLLTNRLGNLVYAGTFSATQHLNVAQATQLIEQWRTSYISLLNTAYEGLKELIYAAFYGNKQNWAGIGYQKPNLGV